MSKTAERTSTFDPTHSDNVLSGLNLLWRRQFMCDVTLYVGEREFRCHRAVLASCSHYFRALFENGLADRDSPWRDSSQKSPRSSPGREAPADVPKAAPASSLALPGCPPGGLALVLEYIYTANITLSMDTVEEVLVAAKHLHMSAVNKLCAQFLNDQISVQNYKQVNRLAAAHGLDETRKLANRYLIEDILALSFSGVCAVLDGLPPPVDSELALFQMAVMWLEHNREERMVHTPELMQRLRFALIPASELVEHVQSVDFMRTEPVCQKMLLDAMNYHLMPFRQHFMQSASSRIRSNKQTLLLLGGLPPGPDRLPSNLIQFYDETHKTWKILTGMPYNNAHHCVVEVENFLFVLGGEDRWNPNGKHSTAFASRYDPRFNTWVQLPPMHERRASFYACHVNKQLFVVGGRNETGYLSSVEGYSLEKNEWHYTAALPSPLAAHAGALHNGKVYVSGGVHNGEYVKWLQCFDPERNVWTKRANMSTKRAIHVLSSLGGCLYAIGGNHLKGSSHLDVLLVERYCPHTDTWSVLPSAMLEGRSGPGCSVLDNLVYLVGGYSWSMGAYKSSTLCYNPETDSWMELEGEMVEPLAGPVSVTAMLPSHVLSRA
uniref:Kelch-like family member 14 n=1 Tax=Eptatretus burgeri TaxID=7764 RepID=A0A8C4NF10_EPTBU